MALLGLAGASLFLLLPLVQAFSPASSLSFWQALHTIATADKAILQVLFSWSFRSSRGPRCCRRFLLPAGAAAQHPLGCVFQRRNRRPVQHSLFHSEPVPRVLLLICLCVVFDPPFSPRQTAPKVARETRLHLPFLPLYFLTALSIGGAGCWRARSPPGQRAPGYREPLSTAVQPRAVQPRLFPQGKLRILSRAILLAAPDSSLFSVESGEQRPLPPAHTP